MVDGLPIGTTARGALRATLSLALALVACSSSSSGSSGSSDDDGAAGAGGRGGAQGGGAGANGCRNDRPVAVRKLSLTGAPTPDGGMLGVLGREVVVVSWQDAARAASAYDPTTM